MNEPVVRWRSEDSRTIESALRETASRVGGEFTSGQCVSWFDGFWDFFVRERHVLEQWESWEVTGVGEIGAFLLVVLHTPARIIVQGTEEFVRTHFFLERKEALTFPVSSASSLRRLGFHPILTRWGLEVSRIHRLCETPFSPQEYSADLFHQVYQESTAFLRKPER